GTIWFREVEASSGFVSGRRTSSASSNDHLRLLSQASGVASSVNFPRMEAIGASFNSIPPTSPPLTVIRRGDETKDSSLLYPRRRAVISYSPSITPWIANPLVPSSLRTTLEALR